VVVYKCAAPLRLAEIPSKQNVVMVGSFHHQWYKLPKINLLVNWRPTRVTRVDLTSIHIVLNTRCVLFRGAVCQHESTWRHPSKNGNTKICKQTWLGSSGINIPTCIVWKLRLLSYEFHICALVVHPQITFASENNMHLQITFASENNMHLQIMFASACHQYGDSASSVHATSVYTCPAEHVVC